MSKLLTHWTLAFVTVLLLTLAHFNNSVPVETLRLKSFDILQQYDSPSYSQDIAIVTIDEASIEKYGQWPWKRSILADTIWQLREAGVGLIVLPILFSEYDRLGGDQKLLDALVGNGVIIGQTGSFDADKNGVPRGVAKIGDPLPFLFEWKGMLGPIQEFGDNADGVGVLNTVPEIDGVVRRLPLLMKIGEEIFPALAIEVIRVATENPSYQVKSSEAGIDKMRVPGYPAIQTDSNARIWLRWNKIFDEVSIIDNESFKSLKGKTVIIGIKAQGISNIVASPVGGQYNYVPSAVSLQNIIDGDVVSRPYWASLSEIVTTFLLGILIVLISRFTPYWVAGMCIISLGGILLLTTWIAWSKYLYLIDVSMPIVAILIVGLHSIFARFVREFRLKQQIKKQFGTYLSPHMVEKLQKNPELLKLGGETKHMTFLFCDIRGFTPISEQYKSDPQGLTKLVNRFLTPMTDIILKNEGTVDKYMGDCIMAFWNAPLNVKNQEFKATYTALEMLESLEELNKNLKKDGLLPINIGIGINSGSVVVGNMGSSQRFDYSVLGDAVNLAARLEGQSKGYSVKTIIGETTAQKIEEEILCVELDKIAVKGKKEGVKIFTPLGKVDWWQTNSSYVFDEKQHNKMLELYRAKSFVMAKKFCSDLISANAFRGQLNDYYRMMSDRCDEMSTIDLPEKWDGIYVATSK